MELMLKYPKLYSNHGSSSKNTAACISHNAAEFPHSLENSCLQNAHISKPTHAALMPSVKKPRNTI